MYAGDEFYGDDITSGPLDVFPFVDTCEYPIDFDWDENGYHASQYCAKPAVDDEPPRCAEHLRALLG